MKVYIEGDSSGAYADMFLQQQSGWTVVEYPREADLIQFTGGEDVSPVLYGRKSIAETYSSTQRDDVCKALYKFADGMGIPTAGICRGGQFLNVANGGVMCQHIDNHCRPHVAYDIATGSVIEVTSTHHQMMVPSTSGEILLIADRSTHRKYGRTIDSEYDDPIETFRTPGTLKADELIRTANFLRESPDIEAIMYENSLCFQPHPEFHNADHCRALYFGYINELVKG